MNSPYMVQQPYLTGIFNLNRVCSWKNLFTPNILFQNSEIKMIKPEIFCWRIYLGK
jgi:hypothetical protein